MRRLPLFLLVVLCWWTIRTILERVAAWFVRVARTKKLLQRKSSARWQQEAERKKWQKEERKKWSLHFSSIKFLNVKRRERNGLSYQGWPCSSDFITRSRNHFNIFQYSGMDSNTMIEDETIVTE